MFGIKEIALIVLLVIGIIFIVFKGSALNKICSITGKEDTQIEDKYDIIVGAVLIVISIAIMWFKTDLLEFIKKAIKKD